MTKQYKQLEPAEIFSLLSDPTRISIFKVLISEKEPCVGRISEMTNSSLSAVSHQLKKLELLGVVSGCRYGQEICYCLNRENKLTSHLIKLIKMVK
ncbi:MAG: winged helix-turn-helix transcriptional regulator [Candidatus Yanofskybacteria bacterium]|nr:winged helix-turn-helix transcriptional regulator [Candidatus Yanofskybacteria bacterium]